MYNDNNIDIDKEAIEMESFSCAYTTQYNYNLAVIT